MEEGRASCQDSAVWVGMCPIQVPRGIRRQDRAASPFTRSIRIKVPRTPNLVWVEEWSSIMARASPSGTRGRDCSAVVMVAYLRDSLDTVPQIAEEDQRNRSKIEELTTRVAISTQHLALIRSRRTWESWTPVYLPRYWLVEADQMWLYKATITSKVMEVWAQNHKLIKPRTIWTIIILISKTGELWTTSNRISSKTWYNKIKCAIRRKNPTSWAKVVGSHWLSLTTIIGKACMLSVVTLARTT